MDQAKTLTSQIAIRSYFSGEAAGLGLAGGECTLPSPAIFPLVPLISM